MGDTGSLALGAFLASVAVGTGTVSQFLVLTAAFNLEMASVIVQVAYYRWTKARHGAGQRVFKMAPFHHHLELCGWSEQRTVWAFHLFGACLLIINLVLPL